MKYKTNVVVGYCRFVVFLRTIIIIVVLDKNAIDFLFNVPEKMQKFLCTYYKNNICKL